MKQRISFEKRKKICRTGLKTLGSWGFAGTGTVCCFKTPWFTGMVQVGLNPYTMVCRWDGENFGLNSLNTSIIIVLKLLSSLFSCCCLFLSGVLFAVVALSFVPFFPISNISHPANLWSTYICNGLIPGTCSTYVYMNVNHVYSTVPVAQSL